MILYAVKHWIVKGGKTNEKRIQSVFPTVLASDDSLLSKRYNYTYRSLSITPSDIRTNELGFYPTSVFISSLLFILERSYLMDIQL